MILLLKVTEKLKVLWKEKGNVKKNMRQLKFKFHFYTANLPPLTHCHLDLHSFKMECKGDFIDMTQQTFVIGDVHGCYTKLKKLLTYWNPDSEQLIFVGDLIDRGEHSRDVVRLAMKLKQNYGAAIIGGNHEEMLLEWLDSPMQHTSFYYTVGGEETLASFYNKELVQSHHPEKLAEQMQQDFHEEIKFLRSLPDYIEVGSYLYVHAGVNLNLADWKNSGKQFFRTIREPFHQGDNQTGKTIIFGHTPTRRLHPDKRDDIWTSSCKTKIGIDGAAVFGGKLHGLHVKGNGEYQLYSIEGNNKATTKTFQL